MNRRITNCVLVPIVSALSTVVMGPTALAQAAQSPVRVSVLKFKDRSANGASVGPGCHGFYLWADSLGNAFSDLLIEKLEKNPRLRVLERDTIDDVYEKEVDLKNSQSDHSISKGRFEKARITFVGVVDAFEYCESGSKAGLNVGRLFGIGDITPTLKSSKAMVSILIRAIDTTTGRVLATGRAKKEQSKRSVALDVDLENVDFKAADFRQTSLGEAIQGAVNEASDSLIARLKI